MSSRDYRTCFKRMETDAEYAARLQKAGLYVSEHDGKYLDLAGDRVGLQRRIVEDVA